MASLKAPISYKMEVKRVIVRSLQNVFKNVEEYFPGYDSSKLLTDSHITIEYPQRPEQYPSMIVGFREQTLKAGGIAHSEVVEDTVVIQRWLFTGQIRIEIFALTSMDRDFISDSLVNMLSFSRIEGFPFRDYVEANSGVDLQLSVGALNPIAEDTMSGVSWGLTDQRIYTAGYEFGCLGAFISTTKNYDWITGGIPTAVGPWEEIQIQVPPSL
jgi:hypothetical protein